MPERQSVLCTKLQNLSQNFLLICSVISMWLAFLEFTLVGLIFCADYFGLIPISKTPELLLLGWISLRLRKLRWRDVGLAREKFSLRILLVGIGFGALLETFQLTVTQPILAKALGQQPDLELFRVLTGNLKMTLLLIVFSWTLAAFGEEMFWRGYLMDRVARLFRSGTTSWIVSLLLVSAIFGLAHGYQGPAGWIEEALAGIALGGIYLLGGRNLWLPIIAHGISDTIDMVLIFLGKMPGIHG
jgi:membrane protease YdiL (CAAX protease family)